MKHKFWKRAVAFALALTLVTGTSPVNVGSGGLKDIPMIVASAADTTVTIGADEIKTMTSNTPKTFDNVTFTGTYVYNGSYSVISLHYVDYEGKVLEDDKLKIEVPTGKIIKTITLTDRNTPTTIVTTSGTVSKSGQVYTISNVNSNSVTLSETTNYYQRTSNGASITDISVTYASAYSVTFNANGHGTAPSSQNVTPGEKATKPNDLDAGAEWLFKGWYSNSNCTGNAFDFENTAINSDTTLYAKWVQACKVEFNANGHGTAPAAQYIEPNAKADKPDDLDVGIEWVFGGWYENQACTGTAFDFNTAITANKTLYAKWTAAKKVQFDVNGFGDAPATQYIASGKKATEPVVDAYVDSADIGWTMIGWYSNADCTGDAFSFDTAITADTTLYAKWEKAPYKVSCSDEVASAFKLSQKRAKSGDVITLTLKDGYTFDADLTVTDVNVTKNGNTYSFTMPTNDVTVSIPENSITKQEFTITKGSNIASVTIGEEEVSKAPVGDKVTFKVDLPKNQFGDVDTSQILKKLTVSGGSGEVEFEKTAYDTYEMTMPAGNVTISAEFAAVEKYTVFYFGSNATDGKLVSEGVSYEGVLDEDVILGGKTIRSMIADATAQGTMKFKYKDEDGWSAWREIAVVTNPDTANLESQASRLPNGDKVLIIKGETNMVGVSFVADASVSNSTLNYFTVSNGVVQTPGQNNEPSRDGYAFKGWENRKTGTIYQTGSSVTAPTFESGGDNVLVLNAIWERENCTVSFDSDGGSSVEAVSVAYGRTVAEPDDPAKAGYSFAGWVVAKSTGSFAKGEAFDFDTPITENIKLKAEWAHVHSYNCYPLDAAIFKGKFEDQYDKYLDSAHIKLCDEWDDYEIEAHHFDEDGKCKDCGYQLPDSAFVTVNNLFDGTKKRVRKGASCTVTAPEKKNGQVFDCWGYVVGDSMEFNTLSKERSVTFTVPKDEGLETVTVYPFYRTVLTEPAVSLIARPAVVQGTDVKAIQFYADYQLPDGWKATDFVIKTGDNDQLFYFKPDSINLWSGFKDSFLNMIGKKKIGGYYCFEEVDDSLAGQITSFFKATFSKIPVYYPREDNIMTSNKWDGKTLADKMYAGKGITVLDMELPERKLDSPGKSGYIYQNIVPSNQGYGLPKDNDRIFYAMGYLTCVDASGNKHTYILDAISATANDVASDADGKGPVISYSKHTK